MTTVGLNVSANVKLNGSGNGSIRLGPLSAREVWHVVNVSVRANANPTNEAQCLVYVGQFALPENFRDGCVDGSTGDATDKAAGDVKMNEYVWAVWTGGDANQYAYLTVTGTKDV